MKADRSITIRLSWIDNLGLAMIGYFDPQWMHKKLLASMSVWARSCNSSKMPLCIIIMTVLTIPPELPAG
ncbi:MAG: hypothetical protein ACI9ND_002458 [Yoonia sp.]|jgi:hypothetical protein